MQGNPSEAIPENRHIDLSRELIKEFDKEKIRNSLVQLYRRMLKSVPRGQ